MTSLRSIGVVTVLALQLAQSGCAPAPDPGPAHDPGPFYVAPRQGGPAPDPAASPLERHGGWMGNGAAPRPGQPGANDLSPDDAVPGGLGQHGGGSMSVGGGGS